MKIVSKLSLNSYQQMPKNWTFYNMFIHISLLYRLPFISLSSKHKGTTTTTGL